MKKILSTVIVCCILLGMLGGTVLFSASAADDGMLTAVLNGFSDWTQEELNTSSGNNGGVNGCTCALYVETDSKYIVGGGKQAIKSVFSAGSYFCIVNWKYQVGGPCTAGNVWAPVESGVKAEDYDGIRIAVLNSKGEPANFYSCTLRLANGANYSSNMRYWEGTPEIDDEGYIYFPFSGFVSSGTPGGTDIYDYFDNYAKGISMLNYGNDSDLNTCYYSAVELYKNTSGVEKGKLRTAVNKLEGYDAKTYASQISAARAVLNDGKATQEQVDAQLVIINACLKEYRNAHSGKYSYVQLDGIQNWTNADTSSMNGFGATYEISDKGLIGDAEQSVKLTITDATKGRFCFATQAKDGSFSQKNPFAFADTTKGYKLSDFDGIAIAFNDADGEEMELDHVTGRLMRNSTDWGVYYNYERSYIELDKCYANGYYHFSFADYAALQPTAMNDLAILSVLFYCTTKAGDVGYLSDICAYKIDEEYVEPVDTSALEAAIASVTELNTDGRYDTELLAAKAVLEDEKATQTQIDLQVNILKGIIRGSLPAAQFDSNNIVLSFGAVSDLHMEASGTNKYAKAMEILKRQAGGKLDAITVAGDFSANNYKPEIVQAFKSVNDDKLGTDVKGFFITGNHDAQGGDYASLRSFYEELESYLSIDLPSSDYTRGNRHAIINGYHFIGLNMMDYWNANEARFEQADLDWLETELAAARAAAPGQPIFFYSHAPVYGTTYGSDLYTGTYWGSKNVYKYLEDYPEVVTFGGHVHFPLEDERTIHQKDFTSLNCGSVEYMAIENGYLESGSKTTIGDSHSISDGLLVQVDASGNIKVTRMDFGKDSVIKQPFYIPAPDMENETHLMYYDDDHFDIGNTAPEFPAKSSISVSNISSGTLEVTFTSAKDNDMVHHYNFEIAGIPSGHKTTIKSFSEFYYYPKMNMFPESVMRRLTYTPVQTDTAYELKICAVDSRGLESEPLVYNSAIGNAEYAATAGPNLLNIDFITGVPRNSSSIKGVTFMTDGEVGTVRGKAGFVCDGSSRTTASAPSSVYTLSARKMTAEAAFTVGSIGKPQAIFGCHKDTKGYYLYITEDGCPAFTACTSSGAYTAKSDTPFAAGEDHDVIVDFASGKLTLYVDGVVAATASITGNISSNTNVGFTVGAKAASGGGYTDYFNGVIYHAGIGSTNYTADAVAARHQQYVAGRDYANLVRLYAEREAARALKANNDPSNDPVTRIADAYISELSAAISALPMSEAYVDSVIRRDDFISRIDMVAGDPDIPVFAAPKVTGVEDGATYDIADGPVVPQWDASTCAELNFAPIASGTEITAPGEYQMIVLNGPEAVIVKFTVTDNTVAPEVNIEDGASFDLYTDEAPSATWTPTEATATLNDAPYAAGTPISEVGEYTLVVTNGSKQVIVTFAVVDTTPAYTKGDFDNDGEITVTDALAALRIAAKLVVPTDMDIAIGDTDGDGDVTVTDALAILRVAAKLADTL